MRMVLAYQQDEESSADQAGIKFLTATHQSGPRHAGSLRDARQQDDRHHRDQSLPAEPSAAATTPGPAARARHLEPLLQQCRSARAAIPARSDAGEAFRLPRQAGDRVQSLSAERSDVACAICARDRHLPAVGRAGRHAAARRAHRRQARLALFLRDQGAVLVRERARGRGGAGLAQGRRARSGCGPDPHHVRPGAARQSDPAKCRRGDHQSAHGARARGRLGHGLSPARLGLCAQGGEVARSRTAGLYGAGRACIGRGLFL